MQRDKEIKQPRYGEWIDRVLSSTIPSISRDPENSHGANPQNSPMNISNILYLWEIVDKKLNTPLHVAAKQGHEQIITSFRKAMEDQKFKEYANKKHEDGKTARDLAEEYAHQEVAAQLRDNT